MNDKHLEAQVQIGQCVRIRSLESEGVTLGEFIQDLAARYPIFENRIFQSEDADERRVFLRGKEVSSSEFGGTSVRAGDEIIIVSEVANPARSIGIYRAFEPLRVGQTAPNFTLPDTEGNEICLRDVLVSGPAILIFYRGHW